VNFTKIDAVTVVKLIKRKTKFLTLLSVFILRCVLHLHMMLLSLHRVSENLQRLGCTFRAGVNEILFTEYR